MSISLLDLKVGTKGVIASFVETPETMQIINRMREMGLFEGSDIEICHTNPFGADPIAIQAGGQMIALRRSEARLITLQQQ